MSSQPPEPAFYLDGDPFVDPQRAVEYTCRRRGVTREQLGVRRVVVGAFGWQLTRFLAEQCGAKPVEPWLRSSSEPAFLTDDGITIATLPMGAPIAVVLAEEMIACGMETLVVTGSAGSLQQHLPIGSIVVPTEAIREEGTSHHYAPAGEVALATPAVVDAVSDVLREHGLAFSRGRQWTTDAVYREHREKIARYQAEGVLAVDMELSALYTLARFRGIACGAVLAISDELHGDAWEMGFADSRFTRAMTEAATVALDAARRLT
jgi:uridine phosphorylase